MRLQLGGGFKKPRKERKDYGIQNNSEYIITVKLAVLFYFHCCCSNVLPIIGNVWKGPKYNNLRLVIDRLHDVFFPFHRSIILPQNFNRSHSSTPFLVSPLWRISYFALCASLPTVLHTAADNWILGKRLYNWLSENVRCVSQWQSWQRSQDDDVNIQISVEVNPKRMTEYIFALFFRMLGRCNPWK